MKAVVKLLVHYLRKSSENIWTAGAVIATLATIFTLTILDNFSLVALTENHLKDVRVAMLSQPRSQSSNISIILIDETSLADLPYRSPLDRSLITNLLDELEEHSVAAIGINVLFERPTELNKDQALYQRLHSMNVPIVLSAVSYEPGGFDEHVKFSKAFLKGMRTGLSLIYRDPVDYTVRASMLKLVQDDKINLGFAAALANEVGIELPPDERIQIDFRKGPDPSTPPFPIYSASQVNLLPTSVLKDRIVLIGSDLGDSSRLRTPLSVLNKGFDKDLPGVIIEAHLLSQLIENRSMNISSVQEKMLFTLLMAMLGCLLSLSRVSLTVKLLMSLAIVPLAWLSAFLLFIYKASIVPMVTPTLAFVIAAFIGSFWQWRSEFNKREKIHHAFGQFLAPAVVEKILLDPDELELSGEVREVSFLFTDLEGFTQLVESTPPQIMVGLVNDYLEESCDIVMDHGGTIDKIVGDALHVMFNAPVLQADHAQRAVNCALALDEWSEQYRQRQEKQGIKLGVTRIGVNTGSCIVGNFGGKKRFDYTAHGDAINVAARLEAINQRLGTTICVSESTVAQCNDILFRPVATLVLRGKTIGIMTYVPFENLDQEQDQELIDQYEHAYRLLSENDPTAGELLATLAGNYPEDALIKLHMKRLELGESGTTMIIRKK